MLTLRIAPDASPVWRWNGAAYVTDDGASVVTPYAHPMVEQGAATDGTRTAIIVRECVPGRAVASASPVPVTAAELDEITAAARQWPVDFVLIETTDHRPVRVTAGAARTTPLFLAHRDGVLHGSWDMADLRPFTTALGPRALAAIEYGDDGIAPLSHDACNPLVRESFAELVEESMTVHGVPLLQRLLDDGSPLIEAGLVDPDGLADAVREVASGSYKEEPHSKLVEVITLDLAARAFLP